MSDSQNYGSDIEVRVGIMADLDTDPTAWQNIEGLTFDFMPNRQRKERPKLGAPTRQNPLDPTKPRDGFLKGSASAKLDLDTRQLGLLLYTFLGDPVSETGMGPYVHTWDSGQKLVRYGCVQLLNAGAQVRIYRGFLFEALTLSFTGESVQDFDLDAKFRWLSMALADDPLDGAVTAVPAEAPVNRGLYKVNEPPPPTACPATTAGTARSRKTPSCPPRPPSRGCARACRRSSTAGRCSATTARASTPSITPIRCSPRSSPCWARSKATRST